MKAGWRLNNSSSTRFGQAKCFKPTRCTSNRPHFPHYHFNINATRESIKGSFKFVCVTLGPYGASANATTDKQIDNYVM
ncbi:hypothetical protein L218DRAFT_179298 [Marasmius fiardii PR-910]|nr:hypothetical protein L218DRAFT_179298 [Marasmius fiardii PR-910]